MNTISYTITRENLNCGNFNVCKSKEEKGSAADFCSMLMSVISNILNSKEESDDEKDR